MLFQQNRLKKPLHCYYSQSILYIPFNIDIFCWFGRNLMLYSLQLWVITLIHASPVCTVQRALSQFSFLLSCISDAELTVCHSDHHQSLQCSSMKGDEMRFTHGCFILWQSKQHLNICLLPFLSSKFPRGSRTT